MFPVKAKEILPLEHVVIHSVSVRGMLGKMTIWVTNENEAPDANGEYRIRLNPRHWTKIYEKEHPSSPRTYSVMKFETPVVLAPGRIRALYIHSTLEGDEAIVYDNSRGLGMTANNRPQQQRPRYEDAMISVLTGKAHLSNQPFGQVPVWGWGNAWRDHREFVGQLEYGAVYKLWQPDLNVMYGDRFRRVAMRLLACQRRPDNPMPVLPDECVFFVLNMCRWDWFDDTSDHLKIRRRLVRRRTRVQELQRQEEERSRRQRRATAAAAAAAPQAGAAAESPAAGATASCGDGKIAAVGCARQRHDASYDADAEAGEDDDSEDDAVDAGGAAASSHGGSEDGESDGSGGSAAQGEDEGSDDDEDTDNDEESEWERANGYRADGTVFAIRDYSSDEDELVAGAGGADGADNRRHWLSRNLARIHVLRALAGAAAQRNDNP
jgi:hypothetical protein